jgi:membrane protease YdiL (CAAX protease family)
MSILAAASSESGRVQFVFAAVCLAIAGLVAGGLRLWRPGRRAFPERLTWRASAWPLVGVLGAGVFCWWTVSSAFLTYKQAELVARMGPDAKLELSALSPRDMAFLATVPPLAAFAVLVAADYALKRTGAYDLGLGLRRLKSGVFLGILGSACVVPLLFGLMVLIDWAYRQMHFQHPEEHELLHALGQTRDPLVVIPLVAGAALVAPLFEELLFRAHLQTILRRLFTWFAVEVLGQGVDTTPAVRDVPLADVASGTSADPIATIPQAANEQASAEAPGPPEGVEYAPAPTEVVSPAWTTWAAIVVTACLFASVHAMWTWPPIFILALCLGYAYERTGNLWVPILIHASFNAVSTLMFLGGLSN